MTSLSALIIDDEKHARESLKALLELYCPQVQIVGLTDQIDQGINLIQNCNPDIVFLDIEIGENNGFQLLDHLPHQPFQLIFTTAHSEFAIKAFRYDAADYLLKPIQPQELISAVEKAGKATQSDDIQSQIDALRTHLKSEQQDKIMISTMEGLHIIKVSSIVHVEGSANYSTFFLDGGEKILASKNLKYYESMLPSETFYRTHQSHLINLRYIKRISTHEGPMVELSEGSSIPLARRRKEELMSLLRSA